MKQVRGFRCLALLAGVVWAAGAAAQDRPYFITYTHHMEEPGSLEVALVPTIGVPKMANGFTSTWTEFEYGVKAWWTSEFYLNAQSTRRESTLFTGFRWENRFRPLMGEHWINPVLYVEFSRVSEADKTVREVVGFDSERDFLEPNAETRREIEKEIETKLILSSNVRGWNIAENFIAEKNLANKPWEFGYAVGVSRPLKLAATPKECVFCRENFVAGLEMYGGLGDWKNFTVKGTSHYLAPALAWALPNGTTLKVSPGIGLTENSHRLLLRFGVAYEIGGFGRRMRALFR